MPPPPPRQRRRLDVDSDGMGAEAALYQASDAPDNPGQAPHAAFGDDQRTRGREEGQEAAATGDACLRQRRHRRRRLTKTPSATPSSPARLPLADRPLGPTPSTVHAFGSHENARRAHWDLLRGVVSGALAAGDWPRAAEAAAPLLGAAFARGGGGPSAAAAAPAPAAAASLPWTAFGGASLPFSAAGRRELERATLLLDSIEALRWLPPPPSAPSAASTAPLLRRSLRAAAASAASAADAASLSQQQQLQQKQQQHQQTPLLLAAGRASAEATLALAEELALSGDTPQAADVLAAALLPSRWPSSSSAAASALPRQPALVRALALARHAQWLQATGLLGAGGAARGAAGSAAPSSATAALAREAAAEVEGALLAEASESGGNGGEDSELLFAAVQLRLATSGSAQRAAELLPLAEAAGGGGGGGGGRGGGGAPPSDADALALALALSLSAAGEKPSPSSSSPFPRAKAERKRRQAILASALLSAAPGSGRALSVLLSATTVGASKGRRRDTQRLLPAAPPLAARLLRALGCSLFLDASLPLRRGGKNEKEEGQRRARACRAAASPPC